MRIRTSLAIISLTCLPACNTDGFIGRPKNVDGPVVRLDQQSDRDLPDIRIADAQEVDLVEQLAHHRAMYRRTLAALREFYDQHGYNTKRAWAQRELRDLDRVKAFRYVLAAEIPSDKLVPRDSIPEADRLYAQAVDLMKKGGHGTPAIYREDKMQEAFATFRKLIEKYPTSDKIDDAAFLCGEIHKEYFKNEELLAVRWYERAFKWNPKTPHPARFQAAVVYDYRLHDRDRALELYHDVIKNENTDQAKVNFAVRRIAQLTQEVKPSRAAAFVPSSRPGGDSPDEP